MSDPVKELIDLLGIKELWRTQEEALSQGVIKSTKNFVIVAPTGSGKTWAAAFAMWKALKEKSKVLYLVPTAALISSKISDFQNMIEKGGFALGTEKKKWKEVNLVITTFEVLYRTALRSRTLVEDFGLAVVDEFHVLYDDNRGFKLEKVMTILQLLGIRTICLSATFEDRHEICEWLDGKLVNIPEKYRVPKIKQEVLDYSSLSPDQRKKQFNSFLRSNTELAPFLIFCNTKHSTRRRAKELCQEISGNVLDQDALKNEFNSSLKRIALTSSEHDLFECMIKGVAFHHSGLDLRLRELVEKKFVEGKIRYLFSTTTSAYGINFPARTVVVHDLTWFVGKGSVYIPIHMYTQMIGRAGRPGLETLGYAYIVAKSEKDLKKVSDYHEGKLPRAESKIVNDDFFRKTILELIYAKINKRTQILEFFNKTFFNFQSSKENPNFDFSKIVEAHIKYLEQRDFLLDMGVAGFVLTDFGKITLDFLFRTYEPYELRPFLGLNEYLEKKGSVETSFELIYKLTKDFKQVRLAKVQSERSKEIDDYFQDVRRPGHEEYSAYAMFFGWMKNVPENLIEDKFKVYAGPIKRKADEVHKLLILYEDLARSNNIPIPPEFILLRQSVELGVTYEEVPFAKVRGLGRDSVRKLSSYCTAVLKRNFGYKGTLLEVLAKFYKEKGESFVLTKLSEGIKDIGDKRAGMFIDVIRRHIKEEGK